MMLRNFSSLECVPQDVVPTPPLVIASEKERAMSPRLDKAESEQTEIKE